MPDIVDEKQIKLANNLRRLYSLYQQNKDLINVGAYQAGSDSRIDNAIEKQPEILEFLQQSMNEAVDIERSFNDLEKLLG
jgi:flagellum-specific ATP synthase